MVLLRSMSPEWALLRHRESGDRRPLSGKPDIRRHRRMSESDPNAKSQISAMTFLRSTAALAQRVLAEGPPPCGLPACPAGRSRYSCRRYRPVHHAAVIKAWISSYSRRRPGEIDLVGARDFADLPAIPRQPDH